MQSTIARQSSTRGERTPAVCASRSRMVGEAKFSTFTLPVLPSRITVTRAEAGWCWKNLPYLGSVRSSM